MPGKVPRARRPAIRSLARLSRSEDRRERKRFLDSAAWRKLRAAYLAEEPLCLDCEARGLTTIAAEVHHRIAMRSRPELALDPDNLMGLCKPCHSARTARGE